MALIVITVQDTENGAVVSLAAEPSIDMSAAPVGEAQHLAHLMLGALPMNAEMVAPPAVAPSCPSCGGEGFVNTGIDEAPRAECGKCNGTGE